jgi:hypothetical protein
MFANLLALPFLAGTLAFLYLAWKVDNSYAPYMVPFLIIGALIFILSPQINWWWYSRNMPRLSKGLKELLQRFCGFYQQLSPQEKTQFEGRVGLFRMGVNWTPIGWPEDILPPDVELALSAQAVALTFRREKFLFDKFEKVIIYPKPFPSPEHPYPHASELFAPDGCLIFSAEHAMRAFFNPGKFYNVGLLTYPDENWPLLDAEQGWEALEKASGMSRAHVEQVVGIAGLDALPVAIHHYFLFPATLKLHLPEVHVSLEKIFS